ncbi:hypothetical protein ACFQZ0_31080 [Streptomyces erythrogriseus]
MTAGLVLALLGAWMAADAVDRVYLRQPTPWATARPSGWSGRAGTG